MQFLTPDDYILRMTLKEALTAVDAALIEAIRKLDVLHKLMLDNERTLYPMESASNDLSAIVSIRVPLNYGRNPVLRGLERVNQYVPPPAADEPEVDPLS